MRGGRQDGNSGYDWSREIHPEYPSAVRWAVAAAVATEWRPGGSHVTMSTWIQSVRALGGVAVTASSLDRRAAVSPLQSESRPDSSVVAVGSERAKLAQQRHFGLEDFDGEGKRIGGGARDSPNPRVRSRHVRRMFATRPLCVEPRSCRDERVIPIALWSTEAADMRGTAGLRMRRAIASFDRTCGPTGRPSTLAA